MAKADYLVQDQWGVQWLVRATDPAHELLKGLPPLLRPQAVLPRVIIMGEPLEPGHLRKAEQRFERLARYANDDPDAPIADAIARTVQLVTTLKASLGAIGGPVEQA